MVDVSMSSKEEKRLLLVFHALPKEAQQAVLAEALEMLKNPAYLKEDCMKTEAQV